MLPKPESVFDRDREWEALSRFVSSGGDGASLGIVSGRRRQGKTFLLESICQSAHGFYFAAEQATSAESLRSLAAAVADHTQSPFPIHFADWRQAVDALLALGRNEELPVVVDEFPYLADAAPELPSTIQAALSPRRAERRSSQSRLLLCGSAMSFMGSLLAGDAPLRGRAGLELLVPTLDYRMAARFWDIADPRLAVLVNAVVGGTPAYRREFVADDAPVDLDDFDPWMLRTVLNSSSPLFREARYLLSEEPRLRERGLYQSVLAAVAFGNHGSGGIASYTGRKLGDLAHPLNVLEDSGLLVRETDAFRRNRATYRIAEPLIGFYQAILRPNWHDWEHGREQSRLWRRRRHTFDAQVVGPHFEQICRTWVRLFASEETFGGHVGRVASGTVNDPERRTSQELDIAVFGEGDPEPLLAIGEAKWNDVMGLGHLERLRRIRDLLKRSGRFDVSATRLACFSGAGFMPALEEAAQDGDVALVGLDQLYA